MLSEGSPGYKRLPCDDCEWLQARNQAGEWRWTMLYSFEGVVSVLDVCSRMLIPERVRSCCNAAHMSVCWVFRRPYNV